MLSKGLAAVKDMDEVVQRLLKLKQQNDKPAADPMTGLTFEHINLSAEEPPAEEPSAEEPPADAATGIEPRVDSSVGAGPLSEKMEDVASKKADVQKNQKEILERGARIQATLEQAKASRETTQLKADEVLAGVRETMKKFERFDALGKQLHGALRKAMAETQVVEELAMQAKARQMMLRLSL